jgi:ketosteroid isomerase-like protein
MSVTHPTDTTERTRALAEAYGAAWNAHDLDAIMAMHAEDMAFQLHVEGFEEAASPEAVRGQFAFIFERWPDIHFETVRLTVAGELVVHEFVITGTLAGPWPLARERAVPDGRRIAFAGVDVLPCRDGRVVRKDTYLDAIALRNALNLEG